MTDEDLIHDGGEAIRLGGGGGDLLPRLGSMPGVDKVLVDDRGPSSNIVAYVLPSARAPSICGLTTPVTDGWVQESTQESTLSREVARCRHAAVGHGAVERGGVV